MQAYLVTRGNSDIRRVVQPYGMSSEITFEAHPAKKSIFLWDCLSHNTAKQ